MFRRARAEDQLVGARFGGVSEQQEVTNPIVDVMRKERCEANASDSLLPERSFSSTEHRREFTRL